MDKIIKTLQTIDCAQYLPTDFGKCNRLHGHTYQIKNLVIKTSKVVDFSKIKKIIDSLDHYILAPLKHKPFWNEVQKLRAKYNDNTLPQFECYYMPINETTVELISKDLKKSILSIDGVEEVQFELYETPTQGAIIDNEV